MAAWVQVPAWHVSAVQALPSEVQVLPSVTGAAWQVSAVSSHEPVWQASATPEQSRAAPPTHVPAWHVSPTVQYLPSLHDVVSETALQAVGLAWSQAWHALAGFLAP